MANPIVTLTTDFGLADHYVGVMKGVILSIAPRARIVDISHAAASYSISEGAWLIAQAWPYFPPKTVHVVVVDPGVGTERRAIVAEAAGQYFVAPDNGVLGLVLMREQHTVREISNARYFRQPVSRTFHGRDIFAPAAAHLASGVAVASLGPLLGDYQRGDFEMPRQGDDGVWHGRVLHVDRFGNLVTSFRAADFPDLEEKKFRLTIGNRAIDRFAAVYGGQPVGALFAIGGSSGYLEVSMNRASAAAETGAEPGSVVTLSFE
jgi:S-adenosyl-L-methionine hydrolase (adenosine-forming)